MKRLIIAAAALFAAACQPMPATNGGSASAPQQTLAEAAGTTDAALCARAGGKMQPQGRMQSVRCVLSYADAGKRCTDGSECEGDCRIADVTGAPAAGTDAIGQCTATSSRFGCYTTITGGKAEPTICVD